MNLNFCFSVLSGTQRVSAVGSDSDVLDVDSPVSPIYYL